MCISINVQQSENITQLFETIVVLLARVRKGYFLAHPIEWLG